MTILIPTIGRPDYISDTVRSVLAQTWTDMEVLVSDNAPSQGSAEVLDRAGIVDARIRMAVRPVRVPFSEHMNMCLTEALGEFVMIVSDDDQIASGYVAEAVEALRDRPDVTVALGRQHRIRADDKGMIVRPSNGEAETLDGAAYLRGILDGSLETGVLTHISLFARRRAILEAGAFSTYPDGSHADNRLLFALALQGRVALLSSPMYYRVYAQSFGMSTPFPALLEATREYQRDQAQMLRAASRVAAADKGRMLRSARRSNFKLLSYRLLKIYRTKLGLLGTLTATSAIARLYFERYPRATT